ncbi:MAG TPA: hypothetical protein DCQ98_05025, partial [Planctomycetaceae bacterium]|nr:hypothetical protein [Planctomycetaceae bacterium]
MLLPKLVVWQRPDWAVDFWPLLWLSAAVFLAAAVVEGRLRFSRRGTLDAAVEIDRRLDLAERTSSALTLPPELRDAPIGRLLIEDAERKLYGLAEAGRFEGGFQSFSSALSLAIHMASEAYRRDGGLSGTATGLRDFDQKLGGLQRSDLVILAGRPAMGKTS